MPLVSESAERSLVQTPAARKPDNTETKVPREWEAKRIDWIEAVEHSDLGLIKADLRHVGCCAEFFLERGQSVDTKSAVDRAYLDSLLVRYRRCFTTGVRTKLQADDARSLLGEDNDVHLIALKVADTHVCHSVNRMEECRTALSVCFDESRNIVAIGGLREGGIFSYGLSLADIYSLRRISYKWILGYVNPRREELASAIRDRAALLSLEEVGALPDGNLRPLSRDNELATRQQARGRRSAE